MIEGLCVHCGNSFTGTQSKKKYCSDSCRTMALRKINNPHQLLNKVCEKCGTVFRGTHSKKFCSKECGLIDKTCLYCAENFKGHYNARFCSLKCKDAYKVRKPTGEIQTCLVCNEPYEITYGKKKTKKQVCSVKCGNILATSKSGRDIPIDEIERLIKDTEQQLTSTIVANMLGTSHTTILAKTKAKYGSFRNAVVEIRGTYIVTDMDKSTTANYLFSLIDNLLGEIGIREKTFPDLINPTTGAPLRIDYYLPKMPLAIEYHGQQHYKEVEFFASSKDSLKERKDRDSIKEKYLRRKQIPLIVFNYLDEINEGTVRTKLDDYL